jgi:hypothetical protein
MSTPTTSQAIYDLLLADTTIRGLLGTYQLPDAEEPLPAIAVLMDGEDRDAGMRIEGAEVVIARGSSGRSMPFSTGGETISGLFRLYVAQWTPSDAEGGYNASAIVQRIAMLLPGASWSDGTLPDGLGGLQQFSIVWENPEVNTRWEDDLEEAPDNLDQQPELDEDLGEP